MHRVRALMFISMALLLACQGNAPESRTGFADVNGTQLYYEVSGQGEQLVLIHGWSFDSSCWDDQMEALTSRFEVLRYDLRGFGKSALPEPGIAYSHTEDLVALLDILQMERIHLLGHSYGGRLVFDFAMDHPDRVLSLLLPEAAISIRGGPQSEELEAWIGNTWSTGAEEGVEAARTVWLQGSPFSPALKNPRSAAKVRQMVEEYSGWHWENRDPAVSFASYTPEQLRAIKAPTLIILGLLNPPFYHEVAKIQHEHIPNSTLVTMKGVGHALNIEAPEEFNRIVIEFLETVTSWR